MEAVDQWHTVCPEACGWQWWHLNDEKWAAMGAETQHVRHVLRVATVDAWTPAIFSILIVGDTAVNIL